MSNNLPDIINTEVIYNEYFKVERHKLKVLGSVDYNYYSIVTDPIAVMVLAMTKDHRYVVNWEYRIPVQKTLLSCPGGLINVGEMPIAGAERELLEETGYKAKSFVKIGESYPFPGICNQKTMYFFAKDAYPTDGLSHEKTEFIHSTVLLSREEIKKQIHSNAEIDGLLMTALSFESMAHTTF